MEDPVAAPKPRVSVPVGANRIDIAVYNEWDPPTSCDVGRFPPHGFGSDFQELYYTASDTVCGVRWTAWSAPISAQATPWEWGLWYHEFITDTLHRNKLFSVINSLNGPIQFTFDKPVSNFHIWLYGIDRAGHAIAGYDANGMKIDSVMIPAGTDMNFDAVMAVSGIRKVLIYQPLSAPDANGDRSPTDFVLYRAGFEPAPKQRCVTGDSLVDKPAVYDFLMQMREQSGALQSDVGKKKESVWVMRDDGTGPRFEPWPETVGIRCYILNTNVTKLPYGFGSDDVRAILHAHTWKEFDTQQCEGVDVDGKPYLPLKQFGGSPADWRLFEVYNLELETYSTNLHKIDWYVIDGTYLHRMEHNAPTYGDSAHFSFTQLAETGQCPFGRLK